MMSHKQEQKQAAKTFLRLTGRLLHQILSGIFAVALMIGIKLSLAFALGIKDDAHIWRMLQAKFDPTLIDFDVNLYICSPEFDFMVNEYKTLSATLLLPTAAAMTLLVLLAVLRNLFSPSNAPAVEQPPKLSADVVFSVIQVCKRHHGRRLARAKTSRAIR
eukprot:m.226977 g.226977  ORF g.226977 m.226977 type:complete len:161 (+) comp10847_c1_seq23:2178-2660(+)